MYCFDTDVLSALVKRSPPPALIRRIGALHPDEQSTTAINVGELLYGAHKRGGAALHDRVRRAIARAGAVYSFDAAAAAVYGSLRAELENGGKRLDEPDLRIASIALARDLTLVTGSENHFKRVAQLRVENWLTEWAVRAGRRMPSSSKRW